MTSVRLKAAFESVFFAIQKVPTYCRLRNEKPFMFSFPERHEAAGFFSTFFSVSHNVCFCRAPHAKSSAIKRVIDTACGIIFLQTSLVHRVQGIMQGVLI